MVTIGKRFLVIMYNVNTAIGAQNYSIMSSKNNLNSESASVFVNFK